MTRELLGKKIKQERLRSNLSLAQLAAKIGTNPVKLSRVERGHECLHEGQMTALKLALGLTDADLDTPPERMVTYMSLKKMRRKNVSEV